MVTRRAEGLGRTRVHTGSGGGRQGRAVAHLVWLQDPLKEDLLQEGEDVHLADALVLVQVGKHAAPLGPCGRQDAADHCRVQRFLQSVHVHLHKFCQLTHIELPRDFHVSDA